MAQKKTDIVRGNVQQIGDVFGNINVRQPQHGSKSPITPEEQDWDAAETLVEVAKEQHRVSTAMDAEAISVDSGGESDAGASIEYSWKCPFVTCEYNVIGFSLKIQRDEHTRTHIKGNLKSLKCGFWSCRCASIGKPKNPKFYFDDVEQLKNHVHKHHHGVLCLVGNVLCNMCLRNFNDNELSYIEHLDDCVLHALEAVALRMKTFLLTSDF